MNIPEQLPVKQGKLARVTGLEPATSGVTGRHSNRLSYTRAPPLDAADGGDLRDTPISVKRDTEESGEHSETRK